MLVKGDPGSCLKTKSYYTSWGIPIKKWDEILTMLSFWSCIWQMVLALKWCEVGYGLAVWLRGHIGIQILMLPAWFSTKYTVTVWPGIKTEWLIINGPAEKALTQPSLNVWNNVYYSYYECLHCIFTSYILELSSQLLLCSYHLCMKHHSWGRLNSLLHLE